MNQKAVFLSVLPSFGVRARYAQRPQAAVIWRALAFGFAVLRTLVVALLFTLVVTRGASADINVSTAGSPPGSAKRSSYVPAPKELLKQYAPATVMLTLKQFDVPLATASGFFVSSDGLLLTSSPIIRELLINANSTLEITTFDHKQIRDWRLLDCGENKWGTAVGHACALQTSWKPKVFFPAAPPRDLNSPMATGPSVGSDANIIGHPHGLEFTITRLQLQHVDLDVDVHADVHADIHADVHDTPPNDDRHKEYVLAGMLESGNAGGPVFDNEGHLIGVADRVAPWRPITAESDEGASAQVLPLIELERLVRHTSEGLTLADARKLTSTKKGEEIHRLAGDELDPALQFAAQSKSLAGLAGFREIAFDFDQKTLLFNLPAIFSDCALTEKTHDSTMHACSALDGSALFSIRRLPIKGFEELLSRSGQHIAEGKPIQAIETLVAEDTWDLFEPVLTFQQKRALTSEPSIAQCQNIRVGKVAGRTSFFSEAPACRFTTARASQASAVATDVWLAKDQYLYQVSVWMNDPRLADYFSRVPSLAILTAHGNVVQDSPALPSGRGLASDLGPKPLPTYKISLPEAVSFRGAKADRSGRQVDLYGKKLLLDQFEDGFAVAVSIQSRSYLPPDFEEVAKKSALGGAQFLGAKIQTKTIEMDATTISGQAARVVTAFATDSKGRSALLLSAVVFFPDQTFEFTEITATKDPGDAYREFKTLLDGFKRK